jgi:DivIVA domain-containing protein
LTPEPRSLRPEPAFLTELQQLLQAGPFGQPRLAAEDVQAVRFQRTRFKEGYDQHQVDRFLDRAAAELRRRAGGL